MRALMRAHLARACMSVRAPGRGCSACVRACLCVCARACVRVRARELCALCTWLAMVHSGPQRRRPRRQLRCRAADEACRRPCRAPCVLLGPASMYCPLPHPTNTHKHTHIPMHARTHTYARTHLHPRAAVPPHPARFRACGCPACAVPAAGPKAGGALQPLAGGVGAAWPAAARAGAAGGLGLGGARPLGLGLADPPPPLLLGGAANAAAAQQRVGRSGTCGLQLMCEAHQPWWQVAARSTMTWSVTQNVRARTVFVSFPWFTASVAARTSSAERDSTA